MADEDGLEASMGVAEDVGILGLGREIELWGVMILYEGKNRQTPI